MYHPNPISHHVNVSDEQIRASQAQRTRNIEIAVEQSARLAFASNWEWLISRDMHEFLERELELVRSLNLYEVSRPNLEAFINTVAENREKVTHELLYPKFKLWLENQTPDTLKHLLSSEVSEEDPEIIRNLVFSRYQNEITQKLALHAQYCHLTFETSPVIFLHLLKASLAQISKRAEEFENKFIKEQDESYYYQSNLPFLAYIEEIRERYSQLEADLNTLMQNPKHRIQVLLTENRESAVLACLQALDKRNFTHVINESYFHEGQTYPTLLHYAAHNGLLDTLNLILQAEPTFISNYYNRIRGSFFNRKKPFEDETNPLYRPLYLASEAFILNNLRVAIQTLLTKKESTRLNMEALTENSEEKNALQNQCELLTREIRDKRRALINKEYRQGEIISLLLKHQDPIDGLSYQGRTALHAAVFQGHLFLVELLLKHGANPNIKSAAIGGGIGETPLSTGVKRHQVAIARMLVANGATLALENTRGESILEQAFQMNNIDMFAYLLSLSSPQAVRESAEKIFIAFEAIRPARKQDYTEILDLLKTYLTQVTSFSAPSSAP